MKNIKKLPSKQLEKFSTIFTELGLVLVLFTVYLILEHQTAKKTLAEIDFNLPESVMISADQDIIFVKAPKPTPKTERTSTIFVADEPIKKVDNNIIETVLVEPTEDIIPLEIDSLVTVEEPKDEPIETLPFILIENAPVFKGCEGLSKEANKICFDKKMKRFVQRNFDAQLANEIGLNSGKYRISAQFVIDDHGNIIDVQIRAPHSKLKKETQAMLKKLPKFTPGKQRDQAVKVKYILPISFRVD